MSGANIGNGTIVSSLADVVADVPAYTIVGGKLAKLIRQRHRPEGTAVPEAAAWWDRPAEKN